MKYIIALALLMTSSLSANPMMLALSGSTREGSYNQALIREVESIAREENIDMTAIDLKDYDIPFYNADYEKHVGMPEAVSKLRSLMIKSDVIIIASPEYNGSFSALLKNVLDWTSRNESNRPDRSAFRGKTFVLMSASPGKGGGAKGLNHLREVIEIIGGEVFYKEFSLSNAHAAFDNNGRLKDQKTRKGLQNTIRQLKKRI